MKLHLNNESIKVSTDHSGDVELVKYGNNPYETFVSRLGLSMVRLDYKSFYIKDADLEKHFSILENFTFISYKKDSSAFYTAQSTLKANEGNYYICIEHKEDLDDDEIQEGCTKISNIFYDSKDKQATLDCVEHINKFVFNINDNSSKVSIVIKSSQGFNFKKHAIKPLSVDIDTMYNDDFKPVHNHIVESLGNTSKGIIMLHGNPGTGKTNYIKHLTTLVPEKNFVFVPVSIIPYLTDPSFIENLIENENCVLVLEDCEKYLKARDSSPNGDIVSIILNLSDGILSDIVGVQIICTFNSTISKIDEALLRKGRLIDEYHFNKLTTEKASALLGSEVEEEMTLSEVYNIRDKAHRTEVKRTKIGF